MVSALFPIFTSVILCVLYVALAVALLHKHKSTGDVGFLWLGLAVVLWPLASNLIFGWGGHALIQHHLLSSHAAKSKAANGANAADNISTTLDLLQRGISLVLLLIAVRFLSKTKEDVVSEVITSQSSRPISGNAAEASVTNGGVPERQTP
jgi:hypothetical protein